MSKLEQAARYRARAEELRTKADSFPPDNRAMLLKMADNYDAIAAQYESGDWDYHHLKS